MRQRVMIALSMACDPALLIADEPTTALDVTIQAQILALMRRLQAETGMSISFITHNLGVVAHHADDVAVMYAGALSNPRRSTICSRGRSIPTRRACSRASPGTSERAPGRHAANAACTPSAGRSPARWRPRRGCAFEAALRPGDRRVQGRDAGARVDAKGGRGDALHRAFGGQARGSRHDQGTPSSR
jgi:peptide/nickel transport system ATP-binding protein